MLTAQQQRLTTGRHDPQRRAGVQQPIDQPRRPVASRAHSCRTPPRPFSARGTRSGGPRPIDPEPPAARTTTPPPRPRRSSDCARARSTNHTPPATSVCPRWQASITSRVLPIPPTPTTVTSRCVFIRSDSTPSSLESDRRSESSGVGRLPAIAVDVRNGGNSRPPTCHSRITRSTPASRCSPRSVTSQSSRISAGRHIRHHDLPAVAGRHDPRRAVQGPPEVVAVTFLGSTGMKSHPHRQPHPILHLDRRPQRRRRVGERRREPITTRREHHPTVRLDRRPQQHVVLRQRLAHPARIELPPHRRSLDVREQERHGPRRQSHDHDAQYDTASTAPFVPTDGLWGPSLMATPSRCKRPCPRSPGGVLAEMSPRPKPGPRLERHRDLASDPPGSSAQRARSWRSALCGRRPANMLVAPLLGVRRSSTAESPACVSRMTSLMTSPETSPETSTSVHHAGVHNPDGPAGGEGSSRRVRSMRDVMPIARCHGRPIKDARLVPTGRRDPDQDARMAKQRS